MCYKGDKSKDSLCCRNRYEATTLTGTFEFREELIKERAFRYNPEDRIEFQQEIEGFGRKGKEKFQQ